MGKQYTRSWSPLNLPITSKSFLHRLIAIVDGKYLLFVCIEKNGAANILLHGCLMEKRWIRKIITSPKKAPPPPA